MKKTCSNFLRVSKSLLLCASKLEQYEQEAFEAQKRFNQSLTYPGSIRAATPGDTKFYMGAVETILSGSDKHYWRAVIDDPYVEQLIPVRVRFQTNVWVTSSWEQRLHVVQVMVPRHATIGELIERLKVENQSPYLAQLPFTLTLNSRELIKEKELSFYDISANSVIHAIESSDLSIDKESLRPKDWNVDEITSDDLRRSPYKEMGMQPLSNLVPRYEGKPKGYLGKNNYSGMKL